MKGIRLHSSQPAAPPGMVGAPFDRSGVVTGSSAFLIGGLVGFLFGIPRTVQSSTPSTGDTQYQGNTNLEQVSDWLTKIIVGVSLVEIGRVMPALAKLAAILKVPLGGQPSSAAFGLGVVIASALTGFFFFYLWTREEFWLELGLLLPGKRNPGRVARRREGWPGAPIPLLSIAIPDPKAVMMPVAHRVAGVLAFRRS